jgi:lipopolysaccharide/colanic/teichoic acid biosynthesis glycosyltransferase
MIKRWFDILFSLIGLLLLLPFFFLFAILIVVDSGFPVFYFQKRVGKGEKDFYLLKFRTMKNDSDKQGLLTIGKDPRITSAGSFLRKYKMDELPQLLNVLIGDMSIVGPRPEVKKYVVMYNEEQKKVLSIRPGITDYASIEYSNENERIARSKDPELLYIKEIMPEKLKLNLQYISEQSFLTDLKIIIKTIGKILGRSS